MKKDDLNNIAKNIQRISVLQDKILRMEGDKELKLKVYEHSRDDQDNPLVLYDNTKLRKNLMSSFVGEVEQCKENLRDLMRDCLQTKL